MKRNILKPLSLEYEFGTRPKDVIDPMLVHDQERENVVRLLTIVCIAIFGGLFVMALERIHEGNLSGLGPIIAAAFIITGVILRIRRSPIALSGSLVVWTLTVLLEYEAWCNGGISDTAVMALPGVLILACVVLNQRPLLVFGTLLVLSMGVMGYVQINFPLSAPHAIIPNWRYLTDIVLILALTAVLVYLFRIDLIRILTRIRKREGQTRIQSDRDRESEDRLRLVLDASPAAVFIARIKDGTILYANPAACSILRREPQEVLGKSIDDFYAQPEAHPEITDLAKDESSHRNNTVCFRLSDGRPIWVSLSTQFIEHEREEVLLITFIDINDQKRMAESLKESEEKLQAIVNGSPIPQFVIDKHHKVICWNNALEELTAIGALEVIGTDSHWKAFYREKRPCLVDLIVDNDVQSIPDLYKERYVRLNEDGVYGAKDYLQIPAGEPKWLQFKAAAIRDSRGDVMGAVETLENFTDQKASEDKLQESEIRYRRLVETSSDAITLCKFDGTVLMCNQFAAASLGCATAQEVIGKNAILFFAPEDRKRLIRDTINAMETGFVKNMEYHILRADGRRIPVEYSGSILRDEMGKPESILGVTRDITERKAVEKSLRESEERLRRFSDVTREGIVFHENGIIVDVNPTIVAMFGYSAEEAIGRGILELLAADSRDFMRNRMLEGTADRYDIQGIRKDGSIFPIEIVTSLYDDKQGTVKVSSVRDITLRKKLEGSLRQSEEQFAIAFHASPIPIALSRLQDGTMYDVNESFAKLLGYTAREIVGRKLLELNCGFDSEIRKRLLDSFDKDGFVRNRECQLRRRDGTEIIARYSGELIEVGKEKCILTILVDQTEQTHAQEAMKKSEQRFRSLVEYSHVGIFVVNNTYQFLYANDEFCKILGHERREILGNDFRDFLDDESRLSVSEYNEGKQKGKRVPVRHEFTVLRKNGEKRRLEMSSSVMNLPGEGFQTIGQVMDITDRKMAEEAVHESEERYRLLIENSIDLVAEISSDLRLQYTSPNSVSVTGYTRLELENKPVLELIHPDDLPSIMKNLVADKVSGNLRYSHRDGSWHWLEVAGQKFRTSSGEVRGVIIARDITNRKKEEDELQQSRTQLQRFSEHLENTLDEERKRISREIHDELGQLLTIMRFDLSWLKSNGACKDEDFAGRLETIGTCLTQAIASVKRISKELRPPQLDELGIVGAIQLDVSQVESKVGLITHLVIDPPEFYLNKQLSMTLYRVFNEILTNVVRHAGAKNVSISLVKTSQEVVIEVKDDGRGIRKDELKGAMSLGLIGMRERVRQWGGHLAITGREGKGTSVIAQLPLQKKRNGRSAL